MVKLTVDGKMYTQPLTLKMDLRIKTPLPDLRKQFEMELNCVMGINESFETLVQVGSVRAQLKERAAKAGQGALADAIANLDKKAAEIEGASQVAFFGLPPSGKQPENLSTLNQHFGGILAVADSADTAPTTQAAAVYNELVDSLRSLLSRWQQLRDFELTSVNAELKKARLASIDPNKAPEAAPSADGDGDDEP